MYKWISFVIVLGGMTIAVSTHADQRPGCLSTDSGTISWTLPTNPVGPSWSFVAEGLPYPPAASANKVKFTFWRHPCSAGDSQLILSITPIRGTGTLLGFLSARQGSDVSEIDSIVINDPLFSLYNDFSISGDIFSASSPVSGIVTRDDYDMASNFDPSDSMTIAYKATWPLGNTVNTLLSIPAYDPTAYGQGPAPFQIGASITGDWYNVAQQ